MIKKNLINIKDFSKDEIPSGEETKDSILVEPNVVKSWVTNYHSPDNPIVPKNLMYSPYNLMKWYGLQAFDKALNDDLTNVPIHRAEFLKSLTKSIHTLYVKNLIINDGLFFHFYRIINTLKENKRKSYLFQQNQTFLLLR